MLVLFVEKQTQKYWLNFFVMDTCEDVSHSGLSNKVVSVSTIVLEASM